MIYYRFELPCIDYGFMTQKAVKAVMDEVRPYERVDFSKLTEDEINQYIEVWLSGLDREYIEEFASDVTLSDQFFIDTYLSLFRDPLAYQNEQLRLARALFFSPRGKTQLNPNGTSLAKQLEANVNAVLENEGTIEEAA